MIKLTFRELQCGSPGPFTLKLPAQATPSQVQFAPLCSASLLLPLQRYHNTYHASRVLVTVLDGARKFVGVVALDLVEA